MRYSASSFGFAVSRDRIEIFSTLFFFSFPRAFSEHEILRFFLWEIYEKVCKINNGLEKILLKSSIGKDDKDTIIKLFQFLPIKTYPGVNIHTYTLLLIDDIHQVLFSYTKSLN